MIKSMTGYGMAKGSAEGMEITVELKSVNNRHLDISVRTPRSFIFVEDLIKTVVSEYMTRGKVDVFVTVDSREAENVLICVNMPLARGYVDAINRLSDELDLRNELSALSLSRFQDILTIEKREADRDAVSAALRDITSEALQGFGIMRAREGEKLCDDINERINEIERLTLLVEERSPRTVAEYRQKLEQRMRELLGGVEVDESRLLAEAAVFADKTAVNEETVRLKSHISQMREMLSGSSPIGRKLDFLVQEMNREVNTIGSKGNDSDISRYVIDLKSEIEKIREQVQNIE